MILFCTLTVFQPRKQIPGNIQAENWELQVKTMSAEQLQPRRRRRRRAPVWWEDVSADESDETRQRGRRVNGLRLAAWSPGLGSALQGECRSVWHLSRPGDAERSPTFDLILTAGT